MNKLTWTKEKPVPTEECILLTASKWQESYEYEAFRIAKIDFEDKWYWGLVDKYGDEWGAYEDLEADLYAVIEPLK